MQSFECEDFDLGLVVLVFADEELDYFEVHKLLFHYFQC